LANVYLPKILEDRVIATQFREESIMDQCQEVPYSYASISGFRD
jgi:hypothetical protein